MAVQVELPRPVFTTKNLIPLLWTVLMFLFALGLVGYGLVSILTAPGLSDPAARFPRLVWGIGALVAGGVVGMRYTRILTAISLEKNYKRARAAMRIDLLQVLLLAVLAIVLFPVVWILSMSIDPRNFSRPTGLTIIPSGASFEAYRQVLTKPSPNPVSFLELLRNSLLVAGGTAFASVVIGTSAAYAFARLKFPGRQVGMLGFVLVLMIPPGGTLAPLFVLLTALGIRNSLWGLALAFTSTALPFAIWNMKGFIDALPYELEEAAQIDGCTRTQGFIRVILPLALPGMVVTALWGFLTGWSEFILSWTFLTDPSTFTLPMVLRGMVGEYASGTPWSQFAAMSILMSLPPVVIFFLLQRYLVSGLAVGGVKG